MLNYYKRFIRAFWEDFAKSTKEQVIGALLAVAILVLQIHYGVIKQAEIKGNEWAIAWPYIGLVGGFFVIHLVRAPWKLDQEHHATHKQHRNRIVELEDYQKSVEAKEVYLEPSNPLCTTFVVPFNWETGSSPGLSLRSAFTNNRKPGFPGKTAHRVKANITYFDGEREPFTIEGRWVRTNQPAMYSPLEDKTEILRVDFEPGTCHELDIANKLPFEPGCYAVAWDDLRKRMLVGPVVKVKIELIAEYVYQVFECVFETSEGKLNQLE